MAKAWCVTRPGAPLYIGVPGELGGKDVLVWNAHRHYGRLRYPHLVANWEQVSRGGSADAWDQKVHVLRRNAAAPLTSLTSSKRKVR